MRPRGEYKYTSCNCTVKTHWSRRVLDKCNVELTMFDLLVRLTEFSEMADLAQGGGHAYLERHHMCASRRVVCEKIDSRKSALIWRNPRTTLTVQYPPHETHKRVPTYGAHVS